MDVETFLNRDSIECNVEARSKKHALDLLSQLLADAVPTSSPAEIFEVLVSRERLGCTALGEAVAIPHGRVTGIDRNFGAFLKLREPVDFDAPDGEPVDLIFGLLVPQDCTEAKLSDLRALAVLLSDHGLQRQLRHARDADTLYDLLAATDDHPEEAGRDVPG